MSLSSAGQSSNVFGEAVHVFRLHLILNGHARWLGRHRHGLARALINHAARKQPRAALRHHPPDGPVNP
jgi:hypothetical protein